MGNTLLSDDGVGIAVADRLAEIFKNNPDVDVAETSWGGFRIIDLLTGYDRAIIIDAIRTGENPVGSITKLSASEMVHSVRMVSFHDINFATALEFAKELGIPMPHEISVYAIEVQELNLISEKISPKVRTAIDKCVKEVAQEIKEKAAINNLVSGE